VPTDFLSVLLSRASGRPLGELLAEKVTGPLGLDGTGFTADPDRLATQYEPTDDGLRVLDAPDQRFARPPAFESLGSGLVSTAPDVLAFLGALADGGAPLLRSESAAAMTTGQLDDEQRARSAGELDPGTTWGHQIGIHLEGRPMSRGSWGWDGGSGTSAWADPARDVVGVLLTQRLMGGPDDSADWFWQAVADCS
jgi:CubicO group peptidase (beta-lactamase class C family)